MKAGGRGPKCDVYCYCQVAVWSFERINVEGKTKTVRIQVNVLENCESGQAGDKISVAGRVGKQVTKFQLRGRVENLQCALGERA